MKIAAVPARRDQPAVGTARGLLNMRDGAACPDPVDQEPAAVNGQLCVGVGP